jgi:hypothetical protein
MFRPACPRSYERSGELDHYVGNPGGTLWLDEIASVTCLPNSSPTQLTSAWPRDPKAPAIH